MVSLLKTYDAFRLKDAPRYDYIDDRGRERVGYSGEAYTPDYMVKSDLTGKYLRWVFVMTDGKQVSLDSYLELSHPELKGKVHSSKNILERIWGKLSNDEKNKLVESIPWSEVLPVNEWHDRTQLSKAYNYVEKWLVLNKHPLANVTNAETYIAYRIETLLKHNSKGNTYPETTKIVKHPNKIGKAPHKKHATLGIST